MPGLLWIRTLKRPEGRAPQSAQSRQHPDTGRHFLPGTGVWTPNRGCSNSDRTDLEPAPRPPVRGRAETEIESGDRSIGVGRLSPSAGEGAEAGGEGLSGFKGASAIKVRGGLPLDRGERFHELQLVTRPLRPGHPPRPPFGHSESFRCARV